MSALFRVHLEATPTSTWSAQTQLYKLYEAYTELPALLQHGSISAFRRLDRLTAGLLHPSATYRQPKPEASKAAHLKPNFPLWGIPGKVIEPKTLASIP